MLISPRPQRADSSTLKQTVTTTSCRLPPSPRSSLAPSFSLMSAFQELRSSTRRERHGCFPSPPVSERRHKERFQFLMRRPQREDETRGTGGVMMNSFKLFSNILRKPFSWKSTILKPPVWYYGRRHLFCVWKRRLRTHCGNRMVRILLLHHIYDDMRAKTSGCGVAFKPLRVSK